MLKKILWVVLHVFAWLTLYLLPYLAADGKLSTEIFHNVIHIISTALLIIYAYLNHYLLVPAFYLQRKYLPYFFFVLACVLIVIWLPTAFRVFEHVGAHPPPHHDDGPHHDGAGPGGVSKVSYNVILFVICTFTSISLRQQRQLLEMQKEKLSTELSFLKAQINPHFLFNTLNSIYALSIRKSDDAPKAIIQLSELMRYILKDSDADTVPLERELSYINNYISLQKRRLGNTVLINYSPPEGMVTHRVAPLILMSFIENAFKHGINPNQDSAINISISVENHKLRLSVLNNKVTSINQKETMGIGLKNATSRLQHLYPGKHELHIDNNEKTFSINLILDLND